jgi:hypothetical protein
VTRADPVVLGRAVTEGQVLPFGGADPLPAARAVRRALSDAGRRALDVGALVVASAVAVGADEAARFTRRALGPHGQCVPAADLVSDEMSADALAQVAAAHLATLLDAIPARESTGPVRLGIGVGIASDGMTVAFCVALPASGSDG